MDALTFRSTAARLSGWAWLVFAALNFVDLAVRGRDRAAAIAAAVLLLGCGLAYVVGLRPRVRATLTELRVDNPLRTFRLPWSAVHSIEAVPGLKITYDGGEVSAHAVQTSPRAAARARRKATTPDVPDSVAEHLKGRTHTDFVVEQLTELQARAEGEGPPTVSWSISALVALAVPALLLLIILVV